MSFLAFLVSAYFSDPCCGGVGIFAVHISSRMTELPEPTLV